MAHPGYGAANLAKLEEVIAEAKRRQATSNRGK
jgi:hypothetical protein